MLVNVMIVPAGESPLFVSTVASTVVNISLSMHSSDQTIGDSFVPWNGYTPVPPPYVNGTKNDVTSPTPGATNVAAPVVTSIV